MRIAYVSHGVLLHEGAVLLLHRREGRYLGGMWDIPGGTVEPGETPPQAAVREFLEETGLEVEAEEEISRYENLDTEKRPITFVTVTHRMVPRSRIDRVVVNPEEHREHRWVALEQTGELPLVWHVARTLALIGSRG
jgi:8-oxo-dGTP diphosphatase